MSAFKEYSFTFSTDILISINKEKKFDNEIKFSNDKVSFSELIGSKLNLLNFMNEIVNFRKMHEEDPFGDNTKNLFDNLIDKSFKLLIAKNSIDTCIKRLITYKLERNCKYEENTETIFTDDINAFIIKEVSNMFTYLDDNEKYIKDYMIEEFIDYLKDVKREIDYFEKLGLIKMVRIHKRCPPKKPDLKNKNFETEISNKIKSVTNSINKHSFPLLESPNNKISILLNNFDDYMGFVDVQNVIEAEEDEEVPPKKIPVSRKKNIVEVPKKILVSRKKKIVEVLEEDEEEEEIPPKKILVSRKKKIVEVLEEDDEEEEEIPKTILKEDEWEEEEDEDDEGCWKQKDLIDYLESLDN